LWIVLWDLVGRIVRLMGSAMKGESHSRNVNSFITSRCYFSYIDASKPVWTAYNYSYVVESFEICFCACMGARAARIMRKRRIS
jgi:hypothetical protein